MKFPQKLIQKLQGRLDDNALRVLSKENLPVDFSSNDYLGLARSEALWRITAEILTEYKSEVSGSTGSRLISGNHKLYGVAEDLLKEYYTADAALIFNSGYDANVGFFSAVPQRNDVVLFDEYIHASIRDGLQMGLSRNYKFRHNDLQHLESLLQKFSNGKPEVYVVTESVFSMDGDSPDLMAMSVLCEQYGVYLVVDEAHAVGVMGVQGKGLTFAPEIRERVFARIVTFGKAPGVHGAVVLGSEQLRDYLVNFARSLIYTTALPPHALACIIAAHRLMQDEDQRIRLQLRIDLLSEKLDSLSGHLEFKSGNSAVTTILIPGNSRVKTVASGLKDAGFDVKAILSPTVPEGQERLRICLHTYNSLEEIEGLFSRLLIFVEPSLKNV